MKTTAVFALTGMMTLMLNVAPAYADDDIRNIQAFSEGLGLISLEQAKAKALQAKPGMIDDVDLENRNFSKGWDYEFEIIDIDGKEWEVMIDAKTGEVHKISRDWF
tara:strand:- start:2318 stop:2635 length:318 start_codon:yes stop_codon:yes gene_type:complete